MILRSGAVSPVQCLRYALSLPTSVVITGIDGMDILDQAVSVATSFQPLEPAEIDALLARTAAAAQGGRFELFKTSSAFDSTAEHLDWLGEEPEWVKEAVR